MKNALISVDKSNCISANIVLSMNYTDWNIWNIICMHIYGSEYVHKILLLYNSLWSLIPTIETNYIKCIIFFMPILKSII